MTVTELKEVLEKPEKWLPVKGYEGRYEISDLGRVRSLSDGGILRPAVNNNGYSHLTLSKDGKRKDFRVHRLVAQHFIKNDGGKRDVNHKNGIKTDNRACNLEWLTHSENEQHKIYKLKTPGKLFGTPRPVVCLNTGKVYKSISEAKRSLGLPKSSHVQEVCAGKLKQSNGYRWSYYDG